MPADRKPRGLASLDGSLPDADLYVRSFDMQGKLQEGRRRDEWTARVLKRYEYKCRMTGETSPEGGLQAHHLFSYAHYPEMRWNVLNGCAIGRKMHSRFHDEFMKGSSNPTTPDDFLRFIAEHGGRLIDPVAIQSA